MSGPYLSPMLPGRGRSRVVSGMVALAPGTWHPAPGTCFRCQWWLVGLKGSRCLRVVSSLAGSALGPCPVLTDLLGAPTAFRALAPGTWHLAPGVAGLREWIVGVAGSTPVYRRSPLFWGRSWGRVVPCGAQAAVRRTRARMGVDPVTVVLHYVCTKHPGGVGRTSSDCPRDHEFSVPDGPHRAGRTRSEAWMGGVGGVGGGVFRDLGV